MSDDEKRELTEDEKEVALVAWALAARNKAYVPTPEYLPAAESMEARGWLSSRTLDNGDTAYEFTPAGETALGLSALTGTRAADSN